MIEVSCTYAQIYAQIYAHRARLLPVSPELRRSNLLKTRHHRLEGRILQTSPLGHLGTAPNNRV